jgi:hypothetical protein
MVPGRAELRAESPRSGTGAVVAPKANVPFIAPIEPDTNEFRPGAILDVWLNDRTRDPRAITSEPSLGRAVVQGDFFRYNSVNLDPELRRFWGQPLLLKWSAILEITEEGEHVFVSELSKERATGAMTVRTLVRLNDETLFEKDVRISLTNPILERGSRALRLSPGRYRLDVWLAVQNVRDVPPSTQLGTYLSIRSPSLSAAVPVQPSRISHLVRGRS